MKLYLLRIAAALLGLTALALLASTIVTRTRTPAVLSSAGQAVVTSCTDAGFRAAVTAGGAVTFNCGGTLAPATIVLNTFVTINNPVTIDGGGRITLTTDSQFSGYVLHLRSGAAAFRGITMTVGSADAGPVAIIDDNTQFDRVNIFGVSRSSALVNRTNTTRINDSVICDNPGGALLIDGTGIIERSSFCRNGEAGVYARGGQLTIRNSAIVSNTGYGTLLADVPVMLENSTVAFNQNGLYARFGSITFSNTVIGKPPAEAACSTSTALGGALVSRGNNVADDSSCNLIAAGDLQNTPLMLADPAVTTAQQVAAVPLANSPVIDGAPCTLAIDQTSVARTPNNGACEAGAIDVPNTRPGDLGVDLTTPLTQVVSGQMLNLSVIISNSGASRVFSPTYSLVISDAALFQVFTQTALSPNAGRLGLLTTLNLTGTVATTAATNSLISMTVSITGTGESNALNNVDSIRVIVQATPTATPVPTQTPTAAARPTSTATAAPTATAQPTSTATAAPTATQVAGATATTRPGATATQVPTSGGAPKRVFIPVAQR
jgi:hypothetical protein